jgi:hypothetical protein
VGKHTPGETGEHLNGGPQELPSPPVHRRERVPFSRSPPRASPRRNGRVTRAALHRANTRSGEGVVAKPLVRDQPAYLLHFRNDATSLSSGLIVLVLEHTVDHTPSLRLIA